MDRVLYLTVLPRRLSENIWTHWAQDTIRNPCLMQCWLFSTLGSFKRMRDEMAETRGPMLQVAELDVIGHL